MTNLQSYGWNIYISESGHVCIAQPDLGDGEPIVMLHPREVPIVIDQLTRLAALAMRDGEPEGQ